MARAQNYLNNKDILKEIHKSKTAYCSFLLPEYADYDIIVHSVEDMMTLTEAGKDARADRLTKLAQDAQLLEGNKKSHATVILPSDVAVPEVIFRVMTWEHIPLAPPSPPKPVKGKKAKISTLADESEELLHTEYDEPVPEIVAPNAKYVKLNFKPFQHFRITSSNVPELLGKSHWKGDLITGEFSRDHGKITNKLALMYMKLCERYATRGNWRGYCVDSETEALTNRGWLGIDQINESDTILSYSDGKLAWSPIKSIYRSEYDGLMHYITSRSIDALITPKHKLVTTRGLVEIEHVKQSDHIVVMGDAVDAPIEATFTDSFVELAGWVMTEGCYEFGKDRSIKRICVYQNPGPKADRIRNCLVTEGYSFSEGGDKNLCFGIWKESAEKICASFPDKNLNMDFILKLTADQRELLINTMIDGDGWRRGNNVSYCQKDKTHVDFFQALLTLSGKKSNCHYRTDHPSFGKLVNFYSLNVFSKKGNRTRGECLNFNGGLNNGAGVDRSKGKQAFSNMPTVQYNGMVWCPETNYGCFVARRNGKVYLTGNTYNDEMRSQALLQLSQVGLQFDESKSANPFAYYTAAVTNSFTRVLNIEKQNQNIRDDILEMNSMNPSYTRQNSWGGGGGGGGGGGNSDGDHEG